MSVNGQGTITIDDLGGGNNMTSTDVITPLGNAAAAPITITRRINIKIQGSMSDFAQVTYFASVTPIHTSFSWATHFWSRLFLGLHTFGHVFLLGYTFLVTSFSWATLISTYRMDKDVQPGEALMASRQLSGGFKISSLEATPP